ncbi:Hypothetical predicted protein [Mytilus galloprovincialis]|uniref:Uncharacterized protein n=1 Tax=Mytilus galloprovincialis TaxID=29158 RepID=A0A8B6FUT2_MYTGA|nr:Hypothetical predicted protein [Mytilus galloprovincialis]
MNRSDSDDELDQSSIISNMRKPHERNDSNTEKLPTSQRTALSKSTKELWQTEINSDQASAVTEGIRQSCTSRIPNQKTTSENLDFDILDPQPLENLEQILEIANILPSLPEIQQDETSITDTKEHLNTTKDLSKEGKNMDERVKCKLCDIVVECKRGSTSWDGGPCLPCKDNTHGFKCLKTCSCNYQQRCDPVVGCVTSTVTSESSTTVTEADKTETNARNVPISTLSNQDKVKGSNHKRVHSVPISIVSTSHNGDENNR